MSRPVTCKHGKNPKRTCDACRKEDKSKWQKARNATAVGRAYSRKYYAENREINSARIAAAKYSISVESVQLLYAKTHCDLCREAFKSKRNKCVDHNHSTGQVRGVLCTRCNTLVGYVECNRALLEDAISWSKT